MFGQSIILTLIQIGGLGVITIAVSFALLSGKKITLMQRSTMQEAIAAPKVGGIIRLTGFVLKVTFILELLGAVIMMPSFISDYGIKGIWMSFFHSISAFCNAGFGIMGTEGAKYSSLTSYATNPIINITVMTGAGQAIIIVLMLIGGSPGSTAGGIKTTTFAVLLANALSTFRRKEDTQIFKRRVDNSVVRNAATIL